MQVYEAVAKQEKLAHYVSSGAQHANFWGSDWLARPQALRTFPVRFFTNCLKSIVQVSNRGEFDTSQGETSVFVSTAWHGVRKSVFVTLVECHRSVSFRARIRSNS